MSSEQRVIVNMKAALHLFGNGCWSDAQKDWVRPEDATVYTQAELDAWPVDRPFPDYRSAPSRAMSLEEARICCDAFLTAEELDEIYNPEGDGEHPDFTREDWRQEVANEETLCGYWHQCMTWLQVRSEEIGESERAASAPAPGVG